MLMRIDRSIRKDFFKTWVSLSLSHGWITHVERAVDIVRDRLPRTVDRVGGEWRKRVRACARCFCCTDRQNKDVAREITFHPHDLQQRIDKTHPVKEDLVGKSLSVTLRLLAARCLQSGVENRFTYGRHPFRRQ